jgi:hypothetical protein
MTTFEKKLWVAMERNPIGIHAKTRVDDAQLIYKAATRYLRLCDELFKPDSINYVPSGEVRGYADCLAKVRELMGGNE